MSQRYKPYNPDQTFLLPPSMREWLPENDLVYFVMELMGDLDLSAIHAYYEYDYERGRPKARSGQPPFDPRMMTGLLLYAYCVGVPSSRRIAALCERDAAFRVITANQGPDFRTISEFRRIHLGALSGLFVQVLLLARRAGLVRLGHVALDGTKVKANASKHKAMSYGRMQQKEEELAREVAELLSKAEQADAGEDGLYGEDKRGDELPDELQFRAQRLEKIRQAKAALEAEAKQKARREGKLDESDEPKRRKGGRKPSTPPGTPKPKAQRNFTDPESKIMKMGDGGFDQAYNCQAAVDGKAQVIVAQAVTDAANDKEQVEPVIGQVEKNLAAKPRRVMADSGYYSEANVKYLREQGIDDYICPDRLKHGQQAPAVRGRIPGDMSLIDRVRRKLLTKKGRATYGRRKEIVEPVFGQVKRGRGLGQFLLRGLAKVRGEWALWTLTHNMLKMWRAAPG